MTRFVLALALAGGAAAATPLAAQRFHGRSDASVPPGQRPPAGMCRIWIDGIPPGRQPAPTDCATALRNRPSNGTVVFGDDADSRGRGREHLRDRDAGDDERGRADNDHARRGDDEGDDEDDDDQGDDDRGASRRSAEVCPDRRRDGVCIDLPATGVSSGRYPNGTYPSDTYPDGRYPATLPEMIGAVLAAHGQRSPEVAQWLGGSALTPHYEARRGRVPKRVTWIDAGGRVAQVWVDSHGRGRADRVEFYRNGRLYRVAH